MRSQSDRVGKAMPFQDILLIQEVFSQDAPGLANCDLWRHIDDDGRFRKRGGIFGQRQLTLFAAP